MFVGIALVALIGTMLAVLAPPKPVIAATDGDGGRFVAASGRLLDTKSGTGGFSTPMPANTYRTIKVAGQAGLPSSGIGAVAVNATVVATGGQNQLFARESSGNPDVLVLVYDGSQGTNSNSAVLPVAADGTIQLKTGSSVDVQLDVQGYYTDTVNGVAPGGFVPIAGTQIADTPNGTGGLAKGYLTGGKTGTVNVVGNSAVTIPSNASSVVANFVVINRDEQSDPGYITPYAAGASRPVQQLHYIGGKIPTALSATVPLSSDGKMTIYNSAGSIDLLVDIQGYFTSANDGGVFHPAAGNLYDTRDADGALASGGTRVFLASPRGAVPRPGNGVSAVVVTLTSIYGGSNQGTATLWPNGRTRPNPFYSIAYTGNSIRSNTVIVPIGGDGKLALWNSGPDSADFSISLQGWYSALPTGPDTTGLTGQRPSATTLSFPITDQTSARVDVATGNLNVQNLGLTLPGVTSSTPLGVAYNSQGWRPANSGFIDANRWEYALDGIGSLSANQDGVVYTDATGATWPFTTTDDTSYTTPAGFRGTLSRTFQAWSMTMWDSNAKIAFDGSGNPTTVTDRHGQIVTFTRNGTALTGLSSTSGPTAARVATIAYANNTTTISQTNGSTSRKITYTKDSNGNLVSYTDATGKTTKFGYSGSDLTSITAPEGGVTAITYDSSDRVTKVDQRNTTAGSPGTATTRIVYNTSTQTLVAGPRTDQSQAVTAVPRTTYTLDASKHLVTGVTDPAGRQQSKKYSNDNNAVTSSTVGSASPSTTSASYGANGGQSLTSVSSASGATSSATYKNTDSKSIYQPDSSTGSSGGVSKYTYQGGDMTSSSSGSGSNAATASLAYNSDGTVKSATAPGNSGNPTTYSYDGNHQLQVITPPTGLTTGLGTTTFSYDSYGRLASEKDGNGITTSYTYDNDDRQLTTSFSDGTPTVTNTYDGNGNLLTSKSATGTITNTYDQQNRMISTVNTAGGGQVQYGYDLAGNIASVTDGHGTVTQDYDQANVLTATTYPTSGGTAKQLYYNDDHGRRTDTWLNAVASSDPKKPTSWQAHQHVDFIGDHVSEVQAWTGNGDTSQVLDTAYCYYAGTTPGGSCSGAKTADRDQLQWATDKLTGQSTAYAYTYADGSPSARLSSATQTGGTDNKTWSYTYDIAGNRTKASVTGSPDQTLTYNAVGQITTAGYSYDAVGNLTAAPGATFTYNGAEQLTASTNNGVKTAYTYAGADMNKLLSQTTDGGPEYHYTYGTNDPNGVPVITSRQVTGTGTASVIADPSTGQPLDLQTTDGTTSMYVLDGIGNPAAALADTGAIGYTVKYDPYGAETVIKGSTSAQWQQNPYGFKAGVRAGDASGLTKFGYRWQTSTTGGWIERDTLDSPLDPSNANRYAFSASDAINGTDPTGRIFLLHPRDIATQTLSVATTYIAYQALSPFSAIACAPEPASLASCIPAELAVTVTANTIGNATAEELLGEKVTFEPA